MMRKALDFIYLGTGVLAGVSMIGLLLMVWVGILGRQFDFHVPGTDSYAGYLMAASGFLALAHTFKRGEHIRVTLIINALRGRWKKIFELWALGIASLLSLLLAFYSCKLAWQSRVFHDISVGSDATPLWLPQLAMALGTVILAIVFVDEFVLEIRGKRMGRQYNEESEALRGE